MFVLFILLSLVNAACVVALVAQVCLFLRQKRYMLLAAEDFIDRMRLTVEKR